MAEFLLRHNIDLAQVLLPGYSIFGYYFTDQMINQNEVGAKIFKNIEFPQFGKFENLPYFWEVNKARVDLLSNDNSI
jgi:hypothetical protein